jgi:hypothetical protein
MCNSSNCNHKADPFDFSDLEDMDTFNVSPEPVVLTVDESIAEWKERGNQSAQGAIYEEKCGDCRGTGNFYSYTGRLVGPCFKCDGKGTRQFKTSPEQRQKNRERAAAKRQAKIDARNAAVAEKLRVFMEAHEAEVKFITENTWSNFYSSLLNNLGQYGSLTENQLASVRKGMAKAEAKAAAAADREELDISSLNGYYAVPNGDTRLKVRVSHPKKNSRWHGYVFVNDGAAYGSRRNYGRQAPGRGYEGDIVDALKAILADPYEAMVAYGKLTGTCGACGRLLEDEESIEAGIGPVCAKKFA